MNDNVKRLHTKEVQGIIDELKTKLHLDERTAESYAWAAFAWAVKMSEEGLRVIGYDEATNSYRAFSMEPLDNLRGMAEMLKEPNQKSLKPITHIRSLRVVPNNRPINPSSDGNQGDVK
jgi:hypothetical protein